MSEKMRRFLIIPVILVGVVIFVVMTKSRDDVPREELGEHATAVRYIEVEAQDIVPQAVGNGVVSPTRVWSAISQVQGRVIELPSQYRVGMVIRQNNRLLAIDDADYKLALAQAKASIHATEAQLQQLTAQESNLNASLAIEQESLASAEKEWQRLKKLAKQGTVSTSALESQERVYLTQKQQVQNISSSLKLLPSDRAVLEAQLVQQQTQLQQAQLNLERTKVYAPFNARLAQLNVELDQYIRVGEVLAVLDDIDQAEVEAQFPLDQFSQLVPPLDMRSIQQNGEMLGPHLLKFNAVVRLQRNGDVIEWPAHFVRTDASIDPQTRTVGAVVAVDEPYVGAMPPMRPPLVKGMYVGVVLEGSVRENQIAVPRHALHGGLVYVITAENRLERRKVTVGMRQPGFVTLAEGVQAGERVVVSDLIPAVDGMLLAPQEDKQVATDLGQRVRGSLNRREQEKE